MPCNRPVRSTRPGKKMMVKACQSGREKLIHFGATGYQDFRQHRDKARRANFRARHGCAREKNKLTARWWACNKLW
jgi:hypothetical protein